MSHGGPNEQAEIEALERQYALQEPRPLTVRDVLPVLWSLFLAFDALFEWAAVTLFPFQKLLDKFGGRPRKASK